MSAGDTIVGSPLSISGDDTKVVVRGKTVGNGYLVCNTTNRDLINAEAKLGGFVVYNTTTGQEEYWNGATWVALAGAGGISGIPLTFFASTVDGDPTAGGLRLNHATPASATSMFVDDVEASDGTNIRDLIAALGNVIGAQVRLQSKSADENWIVYKVGGYTSASGYGKLTGLTVVDSSVTVTLSTTASDTILSIDVGVPKDLGNQGLVGVRAIAYSTYVDNPTSTIDFTTGALQKKTLSANTTLATPTPPAAGTDVRMRFAQPSSGGVYTYTLTFWAGAIWTGAIPPMPTGIGAELIVVGEWDGTNWRLSGRIAVAGGIEYDASGNLQLSSQLPARGAENVIVDLWPAGSVQDVIGPATLTARTFDYAIATGKIYEITFRVAANDGAGGSVLFKKTLVIGADNVGGAAAVLTTDFSGDMGTPGWTFTAAPSTSNVRVTLGNSTGVDRSYNLIWGAVITDKP